MLDGGLHIEPLPLRLLAGDYDVYVMLAPQAVVSDCKQRVRIRREVNSREFSPFIGDNVEKARVLMGKAVMILPPDVRGKQDIERRDRTSPGNIACYTQPFCVLVKHGID